MTPRNAVCRSENSWQSLWQKSLRWRAFHAARWIGHLTTEAASIPKVAARVRRIAAERGYRPNRAGRMLARAKNPIRIGVIVQSVETMFMHTVFEEIERASAHFTTTGAEVLVRPLEGVDAQQQLDVIDELLEAGVQGIALSPAEDERVRARIQELSERMPVVTFNSDLPDSGRLCYVGVDNFACGRMSAGLMDLLLAGQGKSCWLPGRKTTGRISSVWTAFRPRLPQIFPV